MSFEIKLPLFEGPFDLLLFFIERDELDIYDIPISKITNDFLDYLKHLENLNIEVASEFILVAATLMRIKAKMLLPRPVIDEEGNEVDPREEFVKHLLEYKRYKSVVGDFALLEEGRLSKEARGNVAREIQNLSAINNVEAELQDIDLYKLLKVYVKAIKRYEIEINKPIHTIVQFPYTIALQKEFIMNLLEKEKKISFIQIIKQNSEKIAVIFNFLAVLELLQLQQISLSLCIGYNNFWIEKTAEELVS